MSKRKPKTLREKSDDGSVNRSHEECWLAGYRLGRLSSEQELLTSVRNAAYRVYWIDSDERPRTSPLLTLADAIAAIRAAYRRKP